MNANQLWITAAAVIAIVFLSGYRLHRSGAPYSGILLNVHKLIALAAGVSVVVTVLRHNRVAPLDAAGWLALALTILLLAATVITGGLMAIGKKMPAAVALTHQIGPFLSAAVGVATLVMARAV